MFMVLIRHILFACFKCLFSLALTDPPKSVRNRYEIEAFSAQELGS